ncbi:hypothetical protein NFI96_012676, partial [Prochilodus magdalenae]
YLGVPLRNNLTWSNNPSSLVRKAHQRLFFLRRLRRAGLGSSVLTSFYRCVVESVLCSSINVWHGSCSAADRKALQRVVKAAQRSVGVSLPTTMDIYTSRCRTRATCIMKDPTHPAHSRFVPLPSGRRLRSVMCETNRLRNSFIPEAVGLTSTISHFNSRISVMTAALETKTFKTELLVALHEGIGEIIKTEIGRVLEKEMAGFRADILMVRTELQPYQNSITTELAALKIMSVCSDDIATLQREVARLKAQSELLENKCEDIEARSRRNNIRIVGVPESQDSSSAAILALLKKAFCLNAG